MRVVATGLLLCASMQQAVYQGLYCVVQEWSYLRGGLSTIDRDYGIFNKIHHDIGTHVLHHLFPQVVLPVNREDQEDFCMLQPANKFDDMCHPVAMAMRS